MSHCASALCVSPHLVFSIALLCCSGGNKTEFRDLIECATAVATADGRTRTGLLLGKSSAQGSLRLLHCALEGGLDLGVSSLPVSDKVKNHSRGTLTQTQSDGKMIELGKVCCASISCGFFPVLRNSY